MNYPISDSNYVLAACRPDEPLESGDPRYHDVAKLRRGTGLRGLRRALTAISDEPTFVHRCVCGHRGTGKSTELHVFEDWAIQKGFLPVRIEVDKRLGLIALEATDLFLLAALAAEEGLQKRGLTVPQEAVKAIGKWFAEVVQEDKDEFHSELGMEASAQVKGGLFSLVELIGKFTAAIKASSQHAKTVRLRLRDYPDRLVDMTNALMRDVNEELRVAGIASGILLIFDNLDRFVPEDIDRALFRSSELIRALNAHAIYVVPISLEYERAGPTQDSHGHFIMLPMLALRPSIAHWANTVSDSEYDDMAVETMVAMLARRLELTTLFENQADVRTLVQLSGGCLRDLLHLVTMAWGRCEETDTTITTAAVLGGIRDMRADYKRQLDSADYTALARVAKRRSSEIAGDHLRRLLYRRMALEYLDEQEQPWHDVHPLIVEIPEFQHAYRSLS